MSPSLRSLWALVAAILACTALTVQTYLESRRLPDRPIVRCWIEAAHPGHDSLGPMVEPPTAVEVTPAGDEACCHEIRAELRHLRESA